MNDTLAFPSISSENGNMSETNQGFPETTELIFEVHEAEEGGYWSRALGPSIFTQADTWEGLRSNIKDAVACHFENLEERPRVIRLYYAA